MIPIRDLFEAHLTVKDLQRSMRFFGDALGLELAQVFLERKVAFYWIGRRGNCMLGLWEAGAGPGRFSVVQSEHSLKRGLVAESYRRVFRKALFEILGQG